jgi:hypothetical protein
MFVVFNEYVFKNNIAMIRLHWRVFQFIYFQYDTDYL